MGESPVAFLEWLLEAYRIYNPLDPGDPGNARAINIAFVSQSAPDIRHKLQKLDGFEGKNLSELIEVAQKVCNNRDDADTTQTKKLSKIVAAALKEDTRY